MPPLSSYHTKKLLSMRVTALVCGRWLWDSERRDSPFFTYEEIKAELALREHVPNKAEAKKIRQDKAFSQRHRSSRG